MGREYFDIKYKPSGGMNSDADPLDRKNGDYLRAKNIHFLTQSGQSMFSVQPTLGNEFVYALGSVSTQNKRFRLFIDAINSSDQFTYYFYTANGVELTNVTFTSVAGDVVSTYNSLFSVITVAFSLFGQTFTAGSLVITSATTGYFDFEITTVPFWDYNIVLSSTSANPTLPIVIAEAIDVSLAGPLRHIGSYDVNGDVMVWSTSQTSLPSQIVIQNVSASPNAPLIRISATAHGMVSGERVQINGVTYGSSSIHEANGQWIIDVIDANNFDLLGSAFVNVADPLTGVVTVDPSGIGEIGVALRDDNNESWTYTRLLRSREWNFVTKKQPKTYCERNDIFLSNYWTDDYNVPRKFYYYGPYITDGALSFVAPFTGQYEYGTIAQETILQGDSLGAHLDFDVQLQAGGNLPAGNSRYSFQFVAANGATTLWSDLSNEINVFNGTLPTPATSIYGNDAYFITPKINQLIISDIVPNLYQYVRIANVYYADGVPVASVIGKFLLTQQPTQTFQHTGFETSTETLDIASLLGIQADIYRAKSIDAVSNRLVLSNTATSQVTDFSAWTRSWTHSVIREDMVGIKSRVDSTLRAGEFQEPENLFRRSSRMLNETYRESAKFKLKNGAVTSNFWIDDIRVDDYLQAGVPFNRGNPFGNNRRVASLPSMDLTDSTADVVYTFGIEFQNINWNFLIDGVPMRDLVKEIIFETVELDTNTREVVGSGIQVLSYFNVPHGMPVSPVETQDTTSTVFQRTFSVWPQMASGANGYADFFYASGGRLDNPIGNPVLLNPTYPAGFPNTERAGSLFVPDWLYAYSDYQFQSSDELISYGAPQVVSFSGLSAALIGWTPLQSNEFYNRLRECTGFVGNSGISHSIIESKYIVQGQSDTLVTLGIEYSKLNAFDAVAIFPATGIESGGLSSPSSNVIATATPNSNASAFSDYGIRQVQIYRPKSNKFGDINSSKYIPTGYHLNYTGTQVDSITVFGGDVMTEKQWLLHQSAINYATGGPPTSGDWIGPGLGGGIAFYSQNHVNTQMTNKNDSAKAWRYPFIDEEDWLNGVEPTPFDPLIYNHGYDIKNGVSLDEAFDPNLKRSTRQPARFWWSDEKPENSLVDNYTNFLPLNFKDLQLSFGEISHHMNVNGQLLSFQDGHFEFQYFDSTGLLVTNAQEVVLGNAGVMAQRGTALSTYGTSHGFSVIKGKTQGGKDAIAWISTKYGKVVKHDPSQGTTVISDIQFMRSFFNNNLRFAALYYTPADGLGIHGVWDDQNSEFIWTMRAHKQVDDWVAGSYSEGDEVIYGVEDFHQIPQIYVSKIDANISTPGSDESWEKILLTDEQYYNYYTVTYNEVKNKFTTFYSYLPKIYLKRGKFFLSPRPVASENKCYEHLRGEYCVWYKDDTGELASRWSISGMSINYESNIEKSFKAMMWSTLITPDLIDITSKNYETFMDASDCERRGDQYVVAVKNDLDPSGANDADTSCIFGAYAEVGLSGPERLYQTFDNFIMKARIVSRVFVT